MKKSEDTNWEKECDNCYPRPGGVIFVEDVNIPYCIKCGRKISSKSEDTMEGEVAQILTEAFQEVSVDDHFPLEEATKKIMKLLSLSKQEGIRLAMEALPKKQNLYEKERKAGNWDWRVQREEGSNETIDKCIQAISAITSKNK